jgi:phosphoribosylaminoimidazole synthetase
MDYLATGKLELEKAMPIIEGIVKGCKEAGCSLIGGETAEMPGFYGRGEYDLAGFVVGISSRGEMIDGSEISPGDRLIGLSSSGLHSNGYSLVRKIVFDNLDLHVDDWIEELGGHNRGRTLGTNTDLCKAPDFPGAGVSHPRSRPHYGGRYKGKPSQDSPPRL